MGYITDSNNTINGLIYKTLDNGENWNICGNMQFKDFYAIAQPTDSVIVATGAGSFVARSSNAGNSWAEFYIGTVPLIDLHFPSSLTGYVCGGTIAKTTNGGNNWFWFTSPGTEMEMHSIIFPNENTGYCSGFGLDKEKVLQKTTNGGANWVPIGYVYDSVNISSVYFVNTTTGWMCGNSGTIRKTTTGGVSSVLYISNELPKDYLLYQNYPNPFNASTRICFEIKAGYSGNIKIMNVN